MNFSDIKKKIVLGTAQFGQDYGIANLSGKPSTREVFDILNVALDNGIRSFDTAPGYGSEIILGQFIAANGLQDEVIVLTKTPSMEGVMDHNKFVRTCLESSLEKLGCPVDVLFFHNSADSELLLKNPKFFESLLQDYPVRCLGTSVYNPEEVERLVSCQFELSFQFPLNVLDRRFEQVKMPMGKRYARSIFLQGLLVSEDGLRPTAPEELFNLQKVYHRKLADHHFCPIDFAVSFVACNDVVDFFLLGVDSAKQLKDILNLKLCEHNNIDNFKKIQLNYAKKWIDPRLWN